MRIGGLQKCSLIDYPGKVAGVIFTRGCQFRCDFCHNPELVGPAHVGPCLREEEVLSFLKKRQKLLDAMVISGGEPTLQPDLEDWLRRLRDLGFLTKLDTNGSRPDVLQSLAEKGLLDFVAMDIKHRLQEAPYGGITGRPDLFPFVRKSVRILMAGPVDCEFRTTLVREIHTREDVLAIAGALSGARRWTLQAFRPQKTLNPQWRHFHPWPADALIALKAELAQKFPGLPVRCLES